MSPRHEGQYEAVQQPLQDLDQAHEDRPLGDEGAADLAGLDLRGGQEPGYLVRRADGAAHRSDDGIDVGRGELCVEWQADQLLAQTVRLVQRAGAW